MRIAVIGAGGIGAIYGASLAKAGADVVFVARGAHVAAMRENGLRIEGDRGEIQIKPAHATDDIASIGIVDYVLFAVKLWDVESAGEQIRPIVGPDTAVIPLQNGVDAAERLCNNPRTRAGHGRHRVCHRFDCRPRHCSPDREASDNDLWRTGRR